MSAIVTLIPAMTAAWPTIAASVMGAASALGFAQVPARKLTAAEKQRCLELEVAGSDAVTGELGADQELAFARDGVTVVFRRDARGKCLTCVTGTGSREALEAAGREFASQVVQQYAYHRLMEELDRRGFSVVSQEVGDEGMIHVHVRRFE